MSRITVKTLYDNKHPAYVVIGWDRPLQHCFVQFELEDEELVLEDDGNVDPEFQAIADVQARTCLQAMSVEDVVQAIAEAKVTVPPAAIEELRKHVKDNAGNVIVQYDADGNRKLVFAG